MSASWVWMFACGSPEPEGIELGDGVRGVRFEAEPVDEPTEAQLRASCDAGEPSACHAVARLEVAAGRYDAGEALWAAGCDRGHAPSCADLANHLTTPS
jgi:hypothetical protein